MSAVAPLVFGLAAAGPNASGAEVPKRVVGITTVAAASPAERPPGRTLRHGTIPDLASLRPHRSASRHGPRPHKESATNMHGIIYLIGLVVVVLAILSFLGLG